jgi:hypothetical protein
MKNTQIKQSILAILVITLSNNIMAQGPPPPPPPPGLPIDGGIFLLMSLAIGYAIKKIR